MRSALLNPHNGHCANVVKHPHALRKLRQRIVPPPVPSTRRDTASHESHGLFPAWLYESSSSFY
jgi:hypothetical protein